MTWCTIESDPAVFTELIASFGARDIEVSELYDLENLPDGEGVLGLVFLFKWQPEEARATRRSQELFNEHVFFAKQVVQNACASQAILAVLLNTEDKEIEIGQELCNLKTFAKDLPYDVSLDSA